MKIQDSIGMGSREASPFKTLQIHPTRKCNLTSRHCYSGSSPGQNEVFDVDKLKQFLALAWEEGYNNISISGGEPFLYHKLYELLSFSKGLGYQNTLESNGMLLGSIRNQQVLEYVDLVAVSIDGKPDVHDYIRNQRGAFDKMLHGVEVLHDLNVPFGFIHTLTPKSYNDLNWLGDFAKNQGAKLLQLGPLKMFGRATSALKDNAIDKLTAYNMFILATYLQDKFQNEMVVQVDILHRDYIEVFPQVVDVFRRNREGNNLSDFMETLIVEETGRIIPIARGFNPKFAIGNIHCLEPDAFKQYMISALPVLKTLYLHTLTKVLEQKDLDIVNWNEILLAESFDFRPLNYQVLG